MLYPSLGTTLLLAAAGLLLTAGFPRASASSCRSVTCEASVGSLTCDPGQVISVQRAVYGRSDMKTCSSGRPYSQVRNTGCTAPNDIVAKSCNGRNTCEITASHLVFGDPCIGTYKYLEVTYTCLHNTGLTRSVTCEGGLAHLACGHGQVIFVKKATYGRSDRSTCSVGRPSGQFQYTGCTGTNTIVAGSCNGKNSCSIKATNSVFGDPCYGTYKYLDVTYTCH